MLTTIPAILAHEYADEAPGRPIHTCRGCSRPLCSPGYCLALCRIRHARRMRTRTYHRAYDRARRAAARGVAS